MTRKRQHPAVGGGELDIEHLYVGHFLEHGPGRQPGSQHLEAGTQGDMQAVGQEADEDVRLDPALELMPDVYRGTDVYRGRTRMALTLGVFATSGPAWGRCLRRPQGIRAGRKNLAGVGKRRPYDSRNKRDGRAQAETPLGNPKNRLS